MSSVKALPAQKRQVSVGLSAAAAVEGSVNNVISTVNNDIAVISK